MMQYEIVGTPFPAVVCRLAQNESMHCESNGMAWMSPNMEMDTMASVLIAFEKL